MLQGTLMWSGGISGAGPTDRVALPGQLTVELKNDTSNSGGKLGYYSPDHTNVRSGWKIGAKIRIKLVSGSDTRYWLYRITEIKPTAMQYGIRRVAVTATDYMDEMSKRKVSGLDIAYDQTGDQALTSLVAALAFAPTATSYALGQFVLPYIFANEQDENTYCLTVAQKISQSDLSYIYVDGDSTGGETLKYENPMTRLASGSSSGSLSDTMSGLEISHSSDNIYNKIRVSTYPVDVDTVVSVLGGISEEFGLEPSETKTIFIPYRDETNTRRMSGIPLTNLATGAIIMTADTDYRISSKPGDGGNDLNVSFTITATAGANNMMLVVTNSAAVKGYVNLLQIRGYAVRMFETVESIASDSTSIYLLLRAGRVLAHQPPPLRRHDPLLQGAAAARRRPPRPLDGEGPRRHAARVRQLQAHALPRHLLRLLGDVLARLLRAVLLREGLPEVPALRGDRDGGRDDDHRGDHPRHRPRQAPQAS